MPLEVRRVPRLVLLTPRVRPDWFSKAVSEGGVAWARCTGPPAWYLVIPFGTMEGGLGVGLPRDRGALPGLLASEWGTASSSRSVCLRWKRFRATWCAVIYSRSVVCTPPPLRRETTKYESKPQVSPSSLGERTWGGAGSDSVIATPSQRHPLFQSDRTRMVAITFSLFSIYLHSLTPHSKQA